MRDDYGTDGHIWEVSNIMFTSTFYSRVQEFEVLLKNHNSQDE